MKYYRLEQSKHKKHKFSSQKLIYAIFHVKKNLRDAAFLVENLRDSNCHINILTFKYKTIGNVFEVLINDFKQNKNKNTQIFISETNKYNFSCKNKT